MAEAGECGRPQRVAGEGRGLVRWVAEVLVSDGGRSEGGESGGHAREEKMAW